MNLTVKDRVVEIQLDPMERVWSCHVTWKIEIPLEDIQRISAQSPGTQWRELRAPGTYWPGLIKAGTYYSDLGRAFWYLRSGQDCLCIDLHKGYYKRVVLGAGQAGQWRSQLQERLTSLADREQRFPR